MADVPGCLLGFTVWACMLWQQPLTDLLPFHLCPDSYASSHNWGTPLRLIWEIGEIAHSGQSSILGTQEGQCGDSHLYLRLGRWRQKIPGYRWLPAYLNPWVTDPQENTQSQKKRQPHQSIHHYEVMNKIALWPAHVCAYMWMCSWMLITHTLTQTMNIFCQNPSQVLISRSTQGKATLYPSPQSPSSQDSCHFFSFCWIIRDQHHHPPGMDHSSIPPWAWTRA